MTKDEMRSRLYRLDAQVAVQRGYEPDSPETLRLEQELAVALDEYRKAS